MVATHFQIISRSSRTKTETISNSNTNVTNPWVLCGGFSIWKCFKIVFRSPHSTSCWLSSTTFNYAKLYVFVLSAIMNLIPSLIGWHPKITEDCLQLPCWWKKRSLCRPHYALICIFYISSCCVFCSRIFWVNIGIRVVIFHKQ